MPPPQSSPAARGEAGPGRAASPPPRGRGAAGGTSPAGRYLSRGAAPSASRCRCGRRGAPGRRGGRCRPPPAGTGSRRRASRAAAPWLGRGRLCGARRRPLAPLPVSPHPPSNGSASLDTGGGKGARGKRPRPALLCHPGGAAAAPPPARPPSPRLHRGREQRYRPAGAGPDRRPCPPAGGRFRFRLPPLSSPGTLKGPAPSLLATTASAEALR